MTWGIIIADKYELVNFNDKWKLRVKRIIDNYTFWEYKFKGQIIIVALSKIGVINASIASFLLIKNFKVCKIFNYGAVGATENLKLYDIIMPKRFYFGDAITPWYKSGTIPQEKNYFENYFLNTNDINLLTTSNFVSKKKQLNYFKESFEFEIIDMEAFAISFVCFKFDVPFFCIKSVGDIVGDEKISIKNINTKIKKASQLAFKELEKNLLILINK